MNLTTERNKGLKRKTLPFLEGRVLDGINTSYLFRNRSASRAALQPEPAATIA